MQNSGVRYEGFLPGQHVELFPRLSAMFHGSGTPIALGVADNQGAIAFDGLDPGRYWLAVKDEHGESRAVMVFARGEAPAAIATPAPARPLSAEEIRERLEKTRPVASAVQESTVAGARSAETIRMRKKGRINPGLGN